MAVKRYDNKENVQLQKNFRISEFRCKCGCGTTLHDNLLSEYLQQIRDHFGRPVYITSGYRCEKHNASIQNASKTSRHMKGQAADFYIPGVKPAEIARYAESIGVRGIGLYEDSDGNFVHIDTREKKSFWYGHKQVYRATFGGEHGYVLGMRTLYRGCSGEDVRALQILLAGRACNGSMGTPDGKFGSNTQGAVELYQEKAGLPVTGVADQQTVESLLGRR